MAELHFARDPNYEFRIRKTATLQTTASLSLNAQTSGVPEFVDLPDLFWARSPSKHTEKGVPIVNLASAAARTFEFALNWQTSATAEPLS